MKKSLLLSVFHVVYMQHLIDVCAQYDSSEDSHN